MKKIEFFIVICLIFALLTACKTNTPIMESDPYLTYCFVPKDAKYHMFNIYQVNSDAKDTEEQMLLKASNIGFNQPDWAPDGRVMAIWGWHTPMMISIYTYDTTSEELIRLTDKNDVYDMFPHWDSNGEKIIFTRQYLLENDRNEIWSMNRDGSDQIKITDGYAGSWSPDGNSIVFSDFTDGNEDLYTCNSDGTNRIQVLESESNETFPFWSPDSKFLLFERYDTNEGKADISSFEICKLKVSNGEVDLLTQNDYLDSSARWSSDGTQIVFISSYNGSEISEVCVMNSDGSQVKKNDDYFGRFICSVSFMASFAKIKPIMKRTMNRKTSY